MDSRIISVRMTTSMLKELKEITKQEHFMDVSDTVRSIVRHSWIENNNPEFPVGNTNGSNNHSVHQNPNSRVRKLNQVA